MTFTSKNEVASENFHALVFRDVLSVAFDIFLGEAKVYEVHPGVSIQASLGINHDILRFEVIESPLGTVSIFEDTNQLLRNV